MDQDIFRAGTSPGSPSTRTEIKMLLCYVLTNIGEPISFTQLHEAMEEHGLVNYFELADAVDALGASGHVTLRPSDGGPELLEPTALGRQAAEDFEKNIPLSVREKGLASALRVLKRKRRESEVSITVEKSQNGFIMHLSIPDREEDLLSVSLFVPGEEECALIRRRFLNSPAFIYNGVLALLTGNKNVLGDLFCEEEEIF